MALNAKKYERMFSEAGTDGDKITSDQKTFLEEAHADNSYLLDPAAFKSSAALLLQLDNITQELDHLRDKILANESCCTAQTGRTHITVGQASAITANTAKVSLVGGTGTALSFGEMIAKLGGRGKPTTYSIVMTAVKVVGGKSTSKSVTLTLT